MVQTLIKILDDCLISIQGDINNINNDIKFTLELEYDNKLNYLDLIIRITRGLVFDIFRKHSQPYHVISSHSNHPMQQELSAIHCYINKLLNIPVWDHNYVKELNIIKQIAYNNNYYPALENRIIKKIKYREIDSEDTLEQSPWLLKNILHCLVCIIFCIGKIFNHFVNANLSYCNNNSLANFHVIQRIWNSNYPKGNFQIVMQLTLDVPSDNSQYP